MSGCECICGTDGMRASCAMPGSAWTPVLLTLSIGYLLYHKWLEEARAPRPGATPRTPSPRTPAPHGSIF